MEWAGQWGVACHIKFSCCCCCLQSASGVATSRCPLMLHGTAQKRPFNALTWLSQPQTTSASPRRNRNPPQCPHKITPVVTTRPLPLHSSSLDKTKLKAIEERSTNLLGGCSHFLGSSKHVFALMQHRQSPLPPPPVWLTTCTIVKWN